MIGLLPTTTIFLATAPTDLRKAYNGLAVLVYLLVGSYAILVWEWRRGRSGSPLAGVAATPS
jgi:hypothetical protein